jgi:hypothetical protein
MGPYALVAVEGRSIKKGSDAALLKVAECGALAENN